MNMHLDTHLISPSADLAETYREFLADFERHGEEPVPRVLLLEAPSFNELIRTLDGYSKGIGLKEGFVPQSTFWLVDADKKLLGVSDIKHELTPFRTPKTATETTPTALLLQRPRPESLTR